VIKFIAIQEKIQPVGTISFISEYKGKFHKIVVMDGKQLLKTPIEASDLVIWSKTKDIEWEEPIEHLTLTNYKTVTTS